MPNWNPSTKFYPEEKGGRNPWENDKWGILQIANKRLDD